jgi:FAD/FMN-containing dehydrogenase
VLADGRVVHCDEEREPDLLWALRGAGGGQLGIVTSLVFDPLPAPTVTTFALSWPAADAAAVVGAWQDWAPDAPDELHAAVQLAAGGDVDSPPAVALGGAMVAGEAETVALVGELIARAGAEPGSASFARMPYREAKRSMVRAEPPGRRHARSEFFRRSLPPGAIGELAANLAGERRPGQAREINFMPWGGAYNRVDASATAFAHRDERFLVEHVAVACDGDDAARRWVARSWSCAHPWGSGGVYPNFPYPELEDWATAYHGANARRLGDVKRAYDPERVFRFHQSL